MDMIFPTHFYCLDKTHDLFFVSIRFFTVWLILHASLEFAFLTSPSSSSANTGTSTLAGNLIFSIGLRPFWLEPEKTPCPVSPTHVEKKEKRARKCSNLIHFILQYKDSSFSYSSMPGLSIGFLFSFCAGKNRALAMVSSSTNSLYGLSWET